MLSETLSARLAQYRIGPKVRALRAQKGLGLVQLGEHSGLSPAMLSKIERGQVAPTLPTLLRIALVFGVGLDHFFSVAEPSPRAVVTRRKERIRLPEKPAGDHQTYFFESLDFPARRRLMESYHAVFPARSAPTEPHVHDGQELIYVISGELIVTIDETEFALTAGDAIHFDATAPHSYRQQGNEDCAVVAVIVT